MAKDVLDVVKESGLLKKTFQAGEQQFTNVGVEAARVKERVSHAVEEGIDAAKKAVKRGRHAAEDLIDETAYRIKREPLNSVAITLGVGFGFGILCGWLLARNKRD